MAGTAAIFAKFLVQAMTKKVNITSDTLKMALLKSTYSPNLTTNTHWADISSHECSGAGYVAGGVALTSVSLTLTKANTWGHSRADTTTYTYGSIVKPATGNGLLYRCVAAGKSGSSVPTYPTVEGKTVVDGTATWACVGDAALVFTSAAVSFGSITVTAKYAVIYDTTPGSATTDPLIVVNTFSATQTPSGVTFTVTPDSVLGWYVFSPPS